MMFNSGLANHSLPRKNIGMNERRPGMRGDLVVKLYDWRG
jgi:hypothetical protein